MCVCVFSVEAYRLHVVYCIRVYRGLKHLSKCHHFMLMFRNRVMLEVINACKISFIFSVTNEWYNKWLLSTYHKKNHYNGDKHIYKLVGLEVESYHKTKLNDLVSPRTLNSSVPVYPVLLGFGDFKLTEDVNRFKMKCVWVDCGTDWYGWEWTADCARKSPCGPEQSIGTLLFE